MKKTLQRVICTLLILTMFAGMTVSYAATDEKSDRKYNTVVLLGDSVAAGYDEKDIVDTEFVRVDHSYTAIIADRLGAEFIPLACQGFRTIEMRHMMEDDFAGDKYLFHDTRDKARAEALIPEFRSGIAKADLITLGLGGNDVFTHLGWVITEEMEKDGAFAEYVAAARELLKKLGIEDNPIEKLIDLADAMDAVPGIVNALPKAFVRGIQNYLQNWDIVIEDIKALNPDATLVVVGLFDTGYKSEADFEDTSLGARINHYIGNAVADAINSPIVASQEKFGYIFVEPQNIVCYGSHPTRDGYRKMADQIFDVIPGASEQEAAKNVVVYSDWYYDIVKYIKASKLFKPLNRK